MILIISAKNYLSNIFLENILCFDRGKAQSWNDHFKGYELSEVIMNYANRKNGDYIVAVDESKYEELLEKKVVNLINLLQDEQNHPYWDGCPESVDTFHSPKSHYRMST